jgi:hypothetical protein
LADLSRKAHNWKKLYRETLFEVHAHKERAEKLEEAIRQHRASVENGDPVDADSKLWKVLE